MVNLHKEIYHLPFTVSEGFTISEGFSVPENRYSDNYSAFFA